MSPAGSPAKLRRMPAPSSNLTQAEARERARLIDGLSYFIEWDLTGPEASYGFETRIEFSGKEVGALTFVELEVAEVTEMACNGVPLPASAYNGQRISLPPLVDRNSLLVRGRGAYDLTGLGLHRSVDPADESVYIYSDFEPYEAHRSFPCFDQPDLKGSFRFRVRVPQDWVVVGPDPGHPEEVSTNDGCRWWAFPPTLLLSPYVLGIAAGPFHQLQHQHRSIPLGLYCAKSLAPFLDAEELFQITAQGLDFFEQTFQMPYPFSKYDQVFCPEKVNGAMESPGCVTISDLSLWRGQPTVRQRSIRADTILHEMAHMWFGDLVTMRWWDDLWLNESFATLMAVFAVAGATEFADAWVSFATVNQQLASHQDQRQTSHPVVTPVADVEAVRGNFDRITYEKGAASLRQLVAHVGEANFFAAVHNHLTNHREANADFDDLIEALEAASGRNVHDWARTWLGTVGMNLLRCEIEGTAPDAGAPISRVTVLQSGTASQPVLRPHRLRLGSFDWVGDQLERVGTVELDVVGPRTDVPDLVGTRRSPLLLPNDGGLTYAKIRLDPTSLVTAERHLGTVADPLARALIWDSSWDMVRDLEMPAHRYAEMVVHHLASESDTTLVGVVLSNFREATRRYAAPERGVDLETRMAEVAWKVLRRAPAGSDQKRAWLRNFIRLATSKGQIASCRAMLEKRDLPAGVELDPELRWVLVSSLAARGAVGAAEIAAALEADPSSTGLVRAEAARAARPTAAAKKQAWARLANPEITIEEVHMVGSSLGGVWHEELVLPYLSRLPKLFDNSLAERGSEFAVHLGDWLPFSLAPSAELVGICRTNLERSDLDPILRRIFGDLLEDNERLQRARKLDATGSDSREESGQALTSAPGRPAPP